MVGGTDRGVAQLQQEFSPDFETQPQRDMLAGHKQDETVYPTPLYVSPRRGIRFVFAPVSDRSLSLSLSVCHFIPSFWNNSATVREGVTKFEMPRQKLLNKCMFLFIAPFDL